MKNRFLKGVLSLMLCLCLLPVAALGEEAEQAEPSVTHSDFTLRLKLHADGFPEATQSLKDWEDFLGKIAIKGYANTSEFLNPESRVYVNAGVYLKDVNRIPFIYDGYHSYRYFVSPAIRGDSLHFQMHNFFEFMLKPYYYMELPTQYMALFMYPEATYYIADSYFTPIKEALQGTGSRVVPYEKLYELCETLDLIASDDPHYERAYFYFTSLLTEMYAADSTLEWLGALEDYLDMLDPEQEGMVIAVSGDNTTYTLGTTQVFEESHAGGVTELTLNLPDCGGYDLSFQYKWEPSEAGASLTAKLGLAMSGQEAITVGIDGQGLPLEGDIQGEGKVTLSLGGNSVKPMAPQSFGFRWSKDQAALPYHLSLVVEALHPQTEKPMLSLNYQADMDESHWSVFKEEIYPQLDFFCLNESFLEEYKERYTATLALSAMPFVLEMSPRMISDTIQFLKEKEILTALGL